MAVMSMAALSMVVLSMSGCSMFVIYLSMILSISCLNHHLFSTYCPDLDERLECRFLNALNVLKTVYNLVGARAVQKRWCKDQKEE